MRDRYIKYDPGNYEALLLPMGEKVFTELDGGRVRCVFTMATPEDVALAQHVLAVMGEILKIFPKPEPLN